MDAPFYRASRNALVLLAVSLLVAAGCGKGKQGPSFELTPVTGTVTLDGKPLPGADVGFYADGAELEGYYGSGGKTDAQGKYELRTGPGLGAPPGQYKVTVSHMLDANGKPASVVDPAAPGSPDEVGLDDVQQLEMEEEAYKESLPVKYSDMEQTELKITVEKDKAEGYDFPLSSG